MSMTHTKQAAWNALQYVTKSGEVMHLTSPECGGNWPSRDYYNLKRWIQICEERAWKRGRAGFAYDSRKIIVPALEGMWIFPDLPSAILKRDAMVAEGYLCPLYSWKNLKE